MNPDRMNKPMMNVPGDIKEKIAAEAIQNTPSQLRIIDVWDENFFQELEKIKELIPVYNYIAMDTEFPGIVEVPRTRTDDYEYQLVKINVDELKLIQLGITLFDKFGQTPPGPCCWQFNFRYDVDNDKSVKSSINVLREAGINFELHKTNGIDHMLFSEYFMSSSLVCNNDTTWICFQGNQDFGYMYRVLANTPIPDSEDGFLDDLKCYFPNLYDIKYMKHEFEELRGGLSRLGDMLCLDRIGQQHQAGSDSWLTGLAYFKLLQTHLQGKDIPANYNNVLYGLGISENDEQYLDNYTSKTDQLEREAREYQEMNDDYMHHEQYQHYPYYTMAGHGMDYGSDNMNTAYNGYPNGLLHPSPHTAHMGYPNSMSPNMHAGYGMSPNHMEYNQDGDHPAMGMQYPMHYQMPQNRHGQNNNMDNYSGGYY